MWNVYIQSGMYLSIPFYWDFPLKLITTRGRFRGNKANFQFPFIGIFRWNQVHCWTAMIMLLLAFNSLLLGFSVETSVLILVFALAFNVLSIPFYWDFPLKQTQERPASNKHWLSIPFYWDFPLKLVDGVVKREKEVAFQFPFIGIFRWNEKFEFFLKEDKYSFQFPFIGIFRWNVRKLSWFKAERFNLSIPFYWDFPLKPSSNAS